MDRHFDDLNGLAKNGRHICKRVFAEGQYCVNIIYSTRVKTLNLNEVITWGVVVLTARCPKGHKQTTITSFMGKGKTLAMKLVVWFWLNNKEKV